MQEKHPGKSISSKGTALVHVPSFGPTRMRRNPKQKFITGGLFMIRVPVRFISVRAIIGILKNLLPRSSQFITGLESMEVWICPGNTWNCPLWNDIYYVEGHLKRFTVSWNVFGVLSSAFFFLYENMAFPSSYIYFSLFIKNQPFHCHLYTANLSSSKLPVFSTNVFILGAEVYLVWIISSTRQLYNPLISLKRKLRNIRLMYSGLLYMYVLYARYDFDFI